MSADSWYDQDWPFCECGVTLLDGEDECAVCAESPHGRECDCHECADYWHEIAERSKVAADRANRALVCSCGWTGAFIEHHNSGAYGATPRAGCVVTYREPDRAEFWQAQGWNVEPKVWEPERSRWVPQSEPSETPSRGRA